MKGVSAQHGSLIAYSILNFCFFLWILTQPVDAEAHSVPRLTRYVKVEITLSRNLVLVFHEPEGRGVAGMMPGKKGYLFADREGSSRIVRGIVEPHDIR